jgi:hypothetical protein
VAIVNGFYAFFESTVKTTEHTESTEKMELNDGIKIDLGYRRIFL